MVRHGFLVATFGVCALSGREDGGGTEGAAPVLGAGRLASGEATGRPGSSGRAGQPLASAPYRNLNEASSVSPAPVTPVETTAT